MMDFHILIVIACVFLASLLSLLFVNKFLRRKTFEEIVAEKKALSDKIYGKDKATVKKPKKQTLKKEMKREKKQQKVREQHEDSDAQSEQPSVEDEEPQGLSKTHVEFEPDPEVVTFNNQSTSRRSSTAEKENNNKQGKGKKDKKSSGKPGILTNKNESVAIKETVTDSAATASNHFDVKLPKDAVEMKKSEKKEDKIQHQNKKEKNAKKPENRQVTEKPIVVENIAVINETPLIKEVKQLEEKARHNSPKNNQQKNKQQNKKQKDSKDLVASLEKLSDSDTVGVSILMNLFRRAELNRSEIQILIDYLLNRQQDMPASHSEWSDDICQKLKRQLEEKEKALAEEQEASIGIQAKLRELRTEVNTERANMSSTIKSYVEKLAVKDQDIALLEQKIKTINDNLTLERQQFQAKLMHEKQAGSQDILAQLQMMQNEMAHKDKCIAELTCIVNASRQAVEESQQKNEIIQNQAQQLHALEQQRDELEQVSNNRIFELEKAKQLENELNELKLELHNAQNALETARSEGNQNIVEKDALKNEISMIRSKEIAEKQQEIDALKSNNSELMQQITSISSKIQEQAKEQTTFQAAFETLQKQLADKERQLSASEGFKTQLQQKLNAAETETKNISVEYIELKKLLENLKQQDITTKTRSLHETEQQAHKQHELENMIASLKADIANKEKQMLSKENLKQQQDLQIVVDTLKTDINVKNEQLKESEKQKEKLSSRENELLQQLQEQKEKNNDLRTKNWKLVEALQNAEAKVSKQSQNAILVQQEKLLIMNRSTGGVGSHSLDTAKDQKQMRDLCQRLCPEAVKACAGTALSVSFDQWVEQVVATHIKQQQQQQQQVNTSSNHKSTQSNSQSSATQNSHANGSRSSGSSINNSSSSPSVVDTSSDDDKAELLKENSILRMRIDELTTLARKTENTLSDLMKKAEEQETHWRNIVISKDHQIHALQHSNGQQESLLKAFNVCLCVSYRNKKRIRIKR